MVTPNAWFQRDLERAADAVETAKAGRGDGLTAITERVEKDRDGFFSHIGSLGASAAVGDHSRQIRGRCQVSVVLLGPLDHQRIATGFRPLFGTNRTAINSLSHANLLTDGQDTPRRRWTSVIARRRFYSS